MSIIVPFEAMGGYLVDRWGVGEGLPANNIISISQSPDGYLWIATNKGLARFDGITFTPVDFLENEEHKGSGVSPDYLFTDREGTLWIGSSAGLTRYDHRTGKFKTYTAADGLNPDRIRLIGEDLKGSLWISFDSNYVNRLARTPGKGFVFTPFNASHGLEGKKINAIIDDSRGNLLFGSRENSIFQFHGGRFSRYPVEGLGRDRLIITMYEDRQGYLWIGTNKGLFRVINGNVEIFTTRRGLSADYITQVHEDGDGNLWIGTLKGVNRVVTGAGGAVSFEPMLETHIITVLFRDMEHSLWIGSYDSGLCRLKEAVFTSPPLPGTAPGEMIMSLFENRRGDFFMGTLTGRAYRSRNGEMTRHVYLEETTGAGIISIAEDSEDNLWLGTGGQGAYKKQGKEFIHYTTGDGLSDNIVISIFRDSRDDLWFGTMAGVSRLRRGVMESPENPHGSWGRVYNVYEDPARNILLATSRGLVVLKKGEFSKEKVKIYLPDVPVHCIYADGDVYWAATGGSGLIRFENRKWTAFTTEQGLASNVIFQVLEDKRENLWLMSDSGILRVSKHQPGNNGRIGCRAFGISDGMKSITFMNRVSRHSALRMASGVFRFATSKGITELNPEKIKINKTPPPVIIENIVMGEDTVIRFTAPTFLSPRKVQFKYRLEGEERDWQFPPPGAEREIVYKDLPPGAYTFTVTACNSDGVWHRTGDSVQFTIEPPFYGTLLFKLSVIFFLAVLIVVRYFLHKKYGLRGLDVWLERGNKKKRPGLNPVYAEECVKKLVYLMEMEKIYRDETLSLQSLAEKLGINHHQLSQLLNERLNKNFFDFVNGYRIEEAMRMLRDREHRDMKIMTIAFEVGFNTRAAFYNVFRKYTGQTPTEYRKQNPPVKTDKL